MSAGAGPPPAARAGPPPAARAPRRILLFYLSSDRRVLGGLLSGLPRGRELTRSAPLAALLQISSPRSQRCHGGEEEVACRGCHILPLGRGRGRGPCAGSPAGILHQGGQRQALRLEGGGQEGHGRMVLVVTVPWGLSVAGSQGRAAREAQVPQSSPQSCCSAAY